MNPRGLVPAIIHKGNSVYESSVCIEYIDEEWEGGKALLPKDTYQRAVVRILSDHISKKVVPPLYRILMKKTDEERDAAKQELIDAVKLLFEDFDSSKGPLFGGDHLNMVDIMLFPFAYRLQLILPHYREFCLPKEGLERYHEWFAAASVCESVRKTLPEEDKLLKEYKKYAEATAQSKVAEAIRKGTALP